MTIWGKVPLIAGGTSGMGKEAAIQLAQAGAKVGIAGRRLEEGNYIVASFTTAISLPEDGGYLAK